MAENVIGKWAVGASYGPVLSQTELYLLHTNLELNPVLHMQSPTFQLVFNILTGDAHGFGGDRELQFTVKDEPATLPRISQLYIITHHSPWCTFVKNDNGVTMNDICQAVWKDYTENMVTDIEFASLPPRVQEHIKRMANNNLMASTGQPWGGFFSPQQQPNRFKRVDWLRERVFFNGMIRDDAYAIQRLGFKAPNIFIMDVSS